MEHSTDEERADMSTRERLQDSEADSRRRDEIDAYAEDKERDLSTVVELAAANVLEEKYCDDEDALQSRRKQIRAIEAIDAGREDHEEGCHGTPRNREVYAVTYRDRETMENEGDGLTTWEFDTEAERIAFMSGVEWVNDSAVREVDIKDPSPYILNGDGWEPDEKLSKERVEQAIVDFCLAEIEAEKITITRGDEQFYIRLTAELLT